MHPRTIRSYIEQGLLRGPEIGGRGARYTDYHVQRLQAIRVLKDYRGLPLPEVRRRLMSMSGLELVAIAQEAAVAEAPISPANTQSALDYLRSIKPRDQREPQSPSIASVPAPQLQSPSAPTPVDMLLGQLDRLAARSKPQRRARGVEWISIAVTPDVEFRVRGPQKADDLARWERIADHLREILMGEIQDKE